jgi:DNA repair protein RecN (Recombination protein N)
LRFQIDEIASAEIDIKIDGEIYQRRERLTHANHIAEHLNAAFYSLDDDASDYSSLSMVNAMNELESASQFDAPSYAKLSEKIADATTY